MKVNTQIFKVVVAAFLGAMIASTSSAATTAATTPHFKKVVWIVLENTDYDKALRQPDFKALVDQGALFANFYGETHPSQGNYIAMIAGSTLKVTDDGPYNLNENHLGDLLESHGLDWRVYAEGYPGNCFLGSSSGNYFRKHTPFLSFANVTTNPVRCAKIVNGESFTSDLQAGLLPAYSMYVPDIENDGHDTDVNYAGRWLTAHFAPLFQRPDIMNETLFVITFDEGGLFGSNRVFTLLLGAGIQPGSRNTQHTSHTSLLKMIEDEFGLGDLGRDDHRAEVITGIWKADNK